MPNNLTKQELLWFLKPTKILGLILSFKSHNTAISLEQ